VRARALRAPVFFSSSAHLTGRCAPPPPQPIAASLLSLILQTKRKPRKNSSFAKQAAKVYHSFYSGIEQMQAAL